MHVIEAPEESLFTQPGAAHSQGVECVECPSGEDDSGKVRSAGEEALSNERLGNGAVADAERNMDEVLL